MRLALMTLVAFAMHPLIGEEAVKLPAAAEAALAKYEVTVGQSLEAHHRAQAKALDTVIAALQKLESSETKAGRLESALALKAERARLDAEAKNLANRALSLGTPGIDPARLVCSNAKEWQALPPALATVSADASKETAIDLKIAKGDKVVIVPNPDDLWTWGPGYAPTNYRGATEEGKTGTNGAMHMEYRIVDETGSKRGGVVNPATALTLGEQVIKLRPRKNEAEWDTCGGTIRVKIYKVK